jgi:hypothetical protein
MAMTGTDPPRKISRLWALYFLGALLVLLLVVFPRKPAVSARPVVTATPPIVVNRDYCEDDYPLPTQAEVERGRVELVMQSSCGLKLFKVPWHAWHPQWGHAKPGQTSPRWVAYQYRGWQLIGPLFPGQSLDGGVAPSRDVFFEGDDGDTVVIVRLGQ